MFNVCTPADTLCVPSTTPVEGFTQIAVPVFGTSIVMVMLLVGVGMICVSVKICAKDFR